MNIVIKNENARLLDNLDVDVIKTLEGIFDRGDLERLLVNFHYKKAIIDITAIKNFYDDNSLYTFLDYFGPDRCVILLNNSEFCNSKVFLSKLVDKQYYSFTRNSSGIGFLLNKPNTYEDVKKYVEKETFSSVLFDSSGNAYQDTSTFIPKNSNQKIIGIKNLTMHAGATTLMCMMVKQLKLNYAVKGIEFNGEDALYFRSDDIVFSPSIEDAKMKIKGMYGVEVIIIDLNNCDNLDICDEVLYLIEPGIIKLNKLLKSGINLNDIKGKLVLNRSSIKKEDLQNFEYETKINVFYNMPPFNDRIERVQVVDNLLVKLGFNKQEVSAGLFGMFK